MKVLIATPCGGGVATVQFIMSLVETMRLAREHKDAIIKQVIAQIPNFNPQDQNHMNAINATAHKHCVEVGLYTLTNESLLARGRNHMAARALYEGFDKIFFIDADEGWTWNDFKALVFSPHPLIAGVVPLKVYPDFPRSFQTSLNFLPFLEDEKYFHRALRTMASTLKMAEGHGSNLVKVAFTGTGFLCIDRSVLLKLAETAAPYSYPEPKTGQNSTHWDFFNGGPRNGEYLSEDWEMCARAREAGFDVVIDVNVRPTHTGCNTFLAM